MMQKTALVNKQIDGTSLQPVYINTSGEMMLKGAIRWKIVIDPGDQIILSEDYHKRGISVVVTEDTKTYFPSDNSQECDVYILAQVKDNRCEADFICRADIFKASGDSYSEPNEKYKLLQWFATLKPQQQDNIMAQIQSRQYDAAKDTSGVKISGARNLLRKYQLTKTTFTPQQQADIEEMLECIQTQSVSSTQRQKAERRLKHLLNINTTSDKKCDLKKSEIISALDKEIYKNDKVKELVAEAIVAARYSEENGLILLLYGNPGVGKTAVAKAIAKVLGLPFGRISLGSASTPLDITGLCHTYDGSDAGEVVKMYYKHNTEHMVLLIDEFDKAVKSSEGNPQNAFTDILSDEHFFKDSFLGTYVRTPDTVLILTANSIENIPDHLKNRCKCIQIDDYENDEKLEIVKRFILPEVLSRYHISPKLIGFHDREILYMIENFCGDAGARDAKKFTEKIICRILSEWDEKGKQTPVRITSKRIDRILGKIVDQSSDKIRFIRNKHLYSAEVLREILSLFELLGRTDIEGSERVKATKKLHCLVSLIPVGDAFSEFDADRAYETMNATHYGMEKVKKTIVEILYSKSVQKQPLSGVRLLLVGGFGIGKSSIARSIAKSLNAPFRRITLNGVSDDAVIKGHSFTYQGSKPGMIAQAAVDMNTTRGLLLLDEVDKLGNREGRSAAETLVDVLDDSAQFTDNFLGVPVDLSEMMFIATANNLNDVPPVIRDRFTVIHLEGYTREEKKHIVEEYLIPQLEEALCPEGVSLHAEEKTVALLLDKYAASFGVRDIKKALEQIARHKLCECRDQKFDAVCLTGDDVVETLGPDAPPRGNVPDVSIAGLSKGLAVSGDNQGMVFAIETQLLPDKDAVITGLPKASTVDSVKLAHSYIVSHYDTALNKKGYHLHFGEGAVEKDGPSAGIAITMSMLSAGSGLPIRENCAYTGEIDLFGNVWAIGGVESKIHAALSSGCTKVFIPYDNYSRSERVLNGEYKGIEIIPVRHIEEVIAAVLPQAKRLAV